MAEVMRIPIIQLYDNLIVSVQVSLSDQLVAQLKEDITAAIEQCGPTGLVIDLSGIDIMDSYISRALGDIGIIAKMMGVRTVISGVAPMIAVTLIEMDLDLKGVRTALTLELALEQLGYVLIRRTEDALPLAAVTQAREGESG